MNRSTCRLLVASTMLAVTGSTGCKEKPQPALERTPIAECTVVEGDVRTHPPKAISWRPLEKGGKLASGDWVRTSERARAVVSYFAGGGFAVEPASTVVVEAEGELNGLVAQVSLRSGVVRGVLSKEGAKDGIVVRDPAGERFVLSPDPGSKDPVGYRFRLRDGKTLEIAITEGTAGIVAPDGKKLSLKRGDALDLSGGRFVGNVIELPGYPALLSPGIDATTAFVEGMEVTMTWAPAESADGYHLQVARDQSFSDMIADVRLKQPHWKLIPSGAGTCLWRVSSRRDGREGEFGFARRLKITEEKVLDLLVAPVDEAVIISDRAPLVEFVWQAVEPPGDYELVVSVDEELGGKSVLRKVLKNQRYQTRELGPGVYFWGVFVHREAGKELLFRQPRKLTVRRRGLGLKAPSSIRWD